MKRLFAILAATLVSVVIATAEPQNEEQQKATLVLQSVVHVNFGDSKRQEHGLGNIENILNEVPEAKIEVVSHGEGITLIQKSTTRHGARITALIKQGVQFRACENTMKMKSIAKDDLVTGVTTVPSGAVEVLRKQQQGYGYFLP